MKTITFIILLVIGIVSAATADMIAVPVTLTHAGRSITALMAVDTGADVTTISPALADALGITRTTHRGMAQMADGRAVPYTALQLGVTVGDMTRQIEVNIMGYAGERVVEGWLGMNFLNSLTMTINWKDKRIYWSK